MPRLRSGVRIRGLGLQVVQGGRRGGVPRQGKRAPLSQLWHNRAASPEERHAARPSSTGAVLPAG